MQSHSSGTSALSHLCRALAATRAPETIEAAACLDGPLIRRLSANIGTGPVHWALEEAARVLPLIEEDFTDVTELPIREIGANIEAWMVDVVALLAEANAADMFVRSMPQVARSAAHLDVPFERVIRSIRKVQGEYTSRFLTTLSNRNLRSEDYKRIISEVSRVTDDGISQFVVHYVDQRIKLVNPQMERQRELIKALISGPGQMSKTIAAEIAKELGFCIDDVHTGFVVIHQPRTAAAEIKILQDLRAKLRNVEILIQSESHSRTSFWITTLRTPGPAILECIDQTLAAFPGAIRTMGEPAHGPEGFRRTHLQANDLAAIARRLASDRVLRWSDHALTLTLGWDLERARWFVRSVLGPLADLTEIADEQRSTLQTYLSSGQSLLKAAQKRKVHRNTVVYRLQKIEHLLGRPLKGPTLDIQCALHLIEQFGNQILDSSPPSATHTVLERECD